MKKAIVEDGVDIRSYFAWSYVVGFRPNRVRADLQVHGQL